MRVGLQKLTLLDYPGETACTVFTCGCNFRCPFCHNAMLVDGREADMPVSTAELLDFLAARRKILDGVCITGGEPLLHRELPDLINSIKVLGYKVKLDTNGSKPEILRSLLEQRAVDYVAMDIKHSKEKYALASGTENMLDKVCESVELLKNTAVECEFRTTVVSPLHTPEDIRLIARWLAGADRYCLQNYKDSGDILAPREDFSPVSPETLELMRAAAAEWIPGVIVRGR